MKFEIKQDFFLNDHPIKLISGSIHYFRVVPEYWEDRILKLKDLGCNTIETYVPWNIHEPYDNQFVFKGWANLRKFILLCQKHDLLIILRLSPYICAEWEFGGLPGWILKYESLKIRTNNPKFLELVDRFYQKVMQQVYDLQWTQGGNIIMMQLENEYGSFSNDQEYLNQIKNIMLKNKVEVELFTSDGPWDNLVENGSLKGVFPTGNFGSRAQERFEFLKKYTQDKYPLMCMEFWDGWFDVWGDKTHHFRDAKEVAQELNEVLKLGSVNLYMFHGGTNFGFYNGSNYKEKLLSRVTSYDYDAPLTEWGTKTLKYDEFQKVINQYTLKSESLNLDFNNEYLELNLTNPTIYGLLSNLTNLAKAQTFANPLNMEMLNQSLGYILYESDYQSALNLSSSLKIWNVADRVHIFHNNQLINTLENDQLDQPTDFNLIKGQNNFKILVENLGRVNYGPKMLEQKKGIIGGVDLNKVFLTNWKHYSLELNNLQNLTNPISQTLEPKFYKFDFSLSKDDIQDTFVETANFGKGNIFVNNFNLGRYWNKGPQKNLYLPKYLLREGENSLVVFETENVEITSVNLVKNPSL